MTKRGYIGSRLRVGRFGRTPGSVDGFPDRPQGLPIRSTDPTPDCEVLGFADYRLGSQAPARFEILPEAGGLVIATQRRIDSPIHHAGPEPAWGAACDPRLENQGNLIRSPYVQVIRNNSFKPHTTGWRPIAHAGLGYLQLTEGQFVPVIALELRWGERRRQTEKPWCQETPDLRRAQAIANLLQPDGVATGTETVIQSLIVNRGFL
jgi:hypothetical protein